ncbi:SRPBCC family protein [Kineococcus glutinatus]|uniref:Hemerythrin-like domain-containing protein n=1 Tax=Kineococcus glutinatus TaxID=1070872 RepID=A0ABP9HDF3_9ACTN
MTTTTAPASTPGTADRRPRLLNPGGSTSRVVAADARALYALVADVTRTGEWSPECRSCTWLDDAGRRARRRVDEVRPGARFRGTSRWGLARWSRTCEVVSAEPGREFAFRTVPHGGADDATVWRYRFEPVPGGTLVTESYEITRGLPPLAERIAATLLPHHRDMRPHMATTLARLAAVAERGPDADQLRLPGQAAAPAGPVDVAGMYVMHHALRRDLTAFAAAAAATPLHERATWRALARRWGRFAHVLHNHHTAEDEGLWPVLVERTAAAGDTAGLATLEAMEAEHARIDPLLAACATGFDALAARADERAHRDLVTGLRRAQQELGNHLGHEERDAMALVQAHLSPADWKRFEVEHAAAGYRLRDIPFGACWAMHELPARGRRFFDDQPVPRLLHRLLHRWFERGERRAFRHATGA